LQIRQALPDEFASLLFPINQALPDKFSAIRTASAKYISPIMENWLIAMRFFHFSLTGKERDAENGYGYFGARYMDHELMTGWLSVDPLAPSYPPFQPLKNIFANPKNIRIFAFRKNKEE
jgi:hypothetical protein